METFSALLAICAGNSPVPGEFPTQRPVTQSFDVFFDLRLNKRLSKQWWGWWFETPSRPLWRHRNEIPRAFLDMVILMLWLTLRWRHNDHDGVSNHQPHGCLLNRLFRRRSKKTSKLRVTGLCVGNSPGPVNSPHKGPVTRKMFPFDDVIMNVICTMMFCFNTFCLWQVTFSFIKGNGSYSATTRELYLMNEDGTARFSLHTVSTGVVWWRCLVTMIMHLVCN